MIVFSSLKIIDEDNEQVHDLIRYIEIILTIILLYNIIIFLLTNFVVFSVIYVVLEY